MKQIWKDIPGYEGLFGDIRRNYEKKSKRKSNRIY